jgi:hypothetical protein
VYNSFNEDLKCNFAHRLKLEMDKVKFYFLLFFAVSSFYIAQSQVVINEVSNRNSGQIADEDNSLEDWIELYNTSGSIVNLSGYSLSDDSTNIEKWNFPFYEMYPGDQLLVFASGKNRKNAGSFHWESPVLPSHSFEYTVPSALISSNWKNPGFNTVGWKTGSAGFGFGDEDDVTVVSDTSITVCIRKAFTLPAGFEFMDVALHVDYDDGFVAYLNGTEIARANINGTPTWNSVASGTHEALMYSGGQPEKFTLDTNLVKALLLTGENVFAIEVHNLLKSTDISLIPYLSFLIKNSLTFFDPSPTSLFSFASNNLHSNFKIDSKGEKIFLFNKTANTVESVVVNNLSYGWSVGRATDGAGTWGIFIDPTPAKPNTTKVYSINREPDPVFSIPEGFYAIKQNVGLSSGSATAEIRYTLDGSEPTSSSTLYSGTPLAITATKVLRACCFSKGNKLPGRSVANTYFINNKAHTLPVISVITNNSNLYGNTGIFDHWDQEWEKSCYIEYFDINKQKKFEQFSGIKIDGGAGGSRSNPQHSFRLEFANKLYGDGSVNYKLIPDQPDRDDFKAVYLRNGSNQWLTFQFKDAMECKMMSYKTKNYYSTCTPVVIYINGSYFGLYEMREKIDDSYFEKNFKANIDSSFHLLSLSYYYNLTLRALNGSVDTFVHDYNDFLSLKTTDADYLQKADKIIDVDYYTDYIVAQSWIANVDWPNNNIKIVKGDFSGYRWRFILLDLEWSLNPNGWSFSTTDHINFLLNTNPNVPYIRFWREMIKNPVYKKKFINRFADIMNTSYLPEVTTGIAQAIYDSSYSEMRNEFVMWNGGEAQANSNMTQYAANMTTFKSELTARSSVVRQNIVSNFGLPGKYSIELNVLPENTGFVQVNTITPEVYPWTGIYFAAVPIRLEAKGIGNYVFDGWNPNAIIKDVNNPVLEADVKVNGYKFTAKFRLQTPEQAITISEINYSSSDLFPTTDWIELYNYGGTAIDLTAWYFKDDNLTHKWVIPGTFILKPNERLVLASDINKFNNAYTDVQNVVGSFQFGLGSPSDSVQLFDSSNNLRAGIKYSSEAPWPTGAFDSGMSLELKDVNADLNSSDNWFAGCLGGSPGAAYSNCDALGAGSQLAVFSAKLYPNPACDEINILLPSSTDGQLIACQIFDIMGKVVKCESFVNSSHSAFKVMISDLSEGIYVAKLSNSDYRQSLRFIKRNN